MYTLILLGIAFVIAFLIYRLGRERGEKAAQARLMVHVEPKAKGDPPAGRKESFVHYGQPARMRGVSGTQHNHKEAIAAGVIGAAAGAAFMHHHDHRELQRMQDRLDEKQRAADDVSYRDFDGAEDDDIDNMDYGDDETKDSDEELNDDADDEYSASDQEDDTADDNTAAPDDFWDDDNEEEH